MLEGNLVRLRALELSDLERVYSWINDREVTRYIAARYPMSRAARSSYSSWSCCSAGHRSLPGATTGRAAAIVEVHFVWRRSWPSCKC